jgi:hypothetical protein
LGQLQVADFEAMDKSNIVPGQQYAVRERAQDDLQHVKVIEAVRSGKWRVEWIDPNPGLIDYVRSRDIVVEWSQRRALLRDEESARRLAETVDRSGYPGLDHPLDTAVNIVMDSTGEPSLHTHKGVLHFERSAIDRVATRAAVEVPTHPAGYRDRHGQERLPWTCALELAESFARAEPSTVLDPIESEEREMALRVREPAGSHLLPLLTEYRAAWAIVRQWAGHDAAVALREKRIAELETLLTQTMWDLRRPAADHERIARRIELALRGR